MRPAVFVMNPYYSGLGIARSLHGKGVGVFALAAGMEAPGIRSRYFDGIYPVPDGRDEPAALCNRLLELARRHAEPPVLFPTRDLDVLFLHRYHDALAGAYILPQPKTSPILRMMDKQELARVASASGIPVPATVACTGAAEVELQMRRLRFPLVLKPRFAYQWRARGLWQQVGMKAFIVDSAKDARACYARLASLESEVLLQEYVPGADSDIVVCCGYAGPDGRPLGHFTGRKLKQNPPLVGTGSIVEAAELTAIVEPSFELLRAFGYRGLAEVEFKYHRSAGRYFLIEVNPRHWDQHELGNLVGVNLSWIAYQDLIGRAAVPSIPVYRNGGKYKWIAERELAVSLAQVFFRELSHARASKGRLRASFTALRKTCSGLGAALSGKRVFGVFKFGDPVPGTLMSFRLLADACRFLLMPRGTRP